MKTELEKFRVWMPTKFGLGFHDIKARNFQDAFNRLGKKDKLKNGWIENGKGLEMWFDELRY